MKATSLAQIVDNNGEDQSEGLTAKQDGFARDVAKGDNLSEAYRKWYNVTTDNQATIHQAASRLMSHPKVAARVTYYLKMMQDRMLRDAVAIRRHVFHGLMRESEDMEATPMSRLKALELLGKIDIVGMFKDRSESTVKDERNAGDIEAELRARLRGLMKDRNDDPGEAGEE